MELEAKNESKTIVEEYPDKIVTTTRFGVIKLMSDKKQYEVSWETYQKLKSLPSDFNGMIEIKELGMTMPLNQIVLMTSAERSETQFKHFVSLPTARLELDSDFNIIHGLKRQIEAKYNTYYTAVCHYTEKDGEREYILDRDCIKELTLLKKSYDGYEFCVAGLWRYGQKVI